MRQEYRYAEQLVRQKMFLPQASRTWRADEIAVFNALMRIPADAPVSWVWLPTATELFRNVGSRIDLAIPAKSSGRNAVIYTKLQVQLAELPIEFPAMTWEELVKLSLIELGQVTVCSENTVEYCRPLKFSAKSFEIEPPVALLVNLRSRLFLKANSGLVRVNSGIDSNILHCIDKKVRCRQLLATVQHQFIVLFPTSDKASIAAFYRQVLDWLRCGKKSSVVGVEGALSQCIDRTELPVITKAEAREFCMLVRDYNPLHDLLLLQSGVNVREKDREDLAQSSAYYEISGDELSQAVGKNTAGGAEAGLICAEQRGDTLAEVLVPGLLMLGRQLSYHKVLSWPVEFSQNFTQAQFTQG